MSTDNILSGIHTDNSEQFLSGIIHSWSVRDKTFNDDTNARYIHTASCAGCSLDCFKSYLLAHERAHKK